MKFLKHPQMNQTKSAAHVDTAQRIVVRIVVDVLIVLVLIVLIWAVVGVTRDVWEAIIHGSTDAFKQLSVELLSVFVFIELFHSLTEYVRFRRIRITTLVDASLAFVLREVWVDMFAGEAEWQRLLAMGALVLVLGAVRALAVVFSPSKRIADMAEAS